jgi:hypothetical protein
MGMSVRKSFALLLVLTLAVSSLIVVKLARASVTRPSIPEFTVKLVENRNIDVTIKNQPFVPYYNASSGWNISFYYNVRIKGGVIQNWTELYLVEDVPTQSDSEYTVLSYALAGENTYILGDKIIEFPTVTQVDFQVEAMIGYVHRVFNPNATNQLEMYPYVFTGETSGWGNIQTLTIGTEPFPTTWIVAAIAIIVVGIATVTVYLIHKRKK